MQSNLDAYMAASHLRAASVSELIRNLSRSPFKASYWNLCQTDGRGPNIKLELGKVIKPEDDGVPEQKYYNQHLDSFFQRHGLFLEKNGERIFFRWCKKKTEIDLARQRQISPSINHRENRKESGLSVVAGPWHYFRDNRYCYLVSGTQIDRGSDGEPVLAIASLQVESKLYGRAGALRAFYSANAGTIRRLSCEADLTEVQLLAVTLGLLD
jgi:hypothetical protein